MVVTKAEASVVGLVRVVLSSVVAMGSLSRASSGREEVGEASTTEVVASVLIEAAEEVSSVEAVATTEEGLMNLSVVIRAHSEVAEQGPTSSRMWELKVSRRGSSSDSPGLMQPIVARNGSSTTSRTLHRLLRPRMCQWLRRSGVRSRLLMR